MASKLSTGQPAVVQGQHTSGIFADMTVDGPEIGTLVLIVDRAKNLPNRKAMGKQNPYCAARLGKEAKKTDTDKRGGQTPKWDQELRFTVHDSLDYHNLKISVFSEDKKTDLIGEAWVSLDAVLLPGGGKCDLWQTLNCKGKYAGEIRIELTYYDGRPKPAKTAAPVVQDAMLRQSSMEKVKRRPLPTGGRAPLTPDTIPEPSAPGRARHGPRDHRTPTRANSMPPESVAAQSMTPPHQGFRHQQDVYGSSPPGPYQEQEAELPIPPHAEYEDKYMDLREHDQYSQPDFLPALPPMRQTGPSSRYTGAQSTPPAHRPTPFSGLPHAHSDPVIPQREDFGYEADGQLGLYTAAPEPLADLDYQHHYVQQRQRPYEDPWQQPYSTAPVQQYQHDPYDTPPPPPNHSRTASAVSSPYSPASPPQPDHNSGRQPMDPYNARPRSRGQQQYVSNSSPLQSIERGALESYNSSPQFGRSSERVNGYESSPSVSPLPARVAATRAGPFQHRHSIGAPGQTQPRQNPHPLSQEVPRARSPAPDTFRPTTSAEVERYRNEADLNAITPIVRPRAISPARQEAEKPERRRKSVYSIQNPVRSFESSNGNPLSTSYARSRGDGRPLAPDGQPRFSDGVPFSPDSFDIPSRPPPSSGWDSTGNNSIDKRMITGWDGREIDPSDHLPVASWAPEPEAKAATRSYGLGRDRDFGPRNDQAGARLGKDVVVNVHRRGQSADPTSSTIKARLIKKNAPASSPIAPLREHPNYNPVPDPYAQQGYSSGFTSGMSPDHESRYEDAYVPQPFAGVPSVPPKVPLEYGQDALSREIASIDIGGGSRARAPAPAAYVPVRSHRDRSSFY